MDETPQNRSEEAAGEAGGGPIVVIPARLASTRLPGKPLAEIFGEPMIVHVWRRATEASIGPVLVAAADPEIIEAVRAVGGEALLTDPDLASGSDRIAAALAVFDPGGRFDPVINLQGDLPTLDPALIRRVAWALEESGADIATLAAEITEASERGNPNVVKVAAALDAGQELAEALYFSRSPVPWPGEDGGLSLFHHIGIYAFRRAALRRFVGLPPSPLEKRERLEQLRALEAGMRIAVARVDTVPLGVDTPADLERARQLLGAS